MNSYITRSLKIGIPVLALAVGAVYAYAWTGPTQQPPGGNLTLPAGNLPAGTSGQTLRHDGTNWIANSTIFNNGTNVGVGTNTPTQKLEVNGSMKMTNRWTVPAAGVWGGNFFEVHTPTWDGVTNGNYGGVVGGHGYYYNGLQSGGSTGLEAGDGQLYVSGLSTLAGEVDATGGSGTSYVTAPIEVRTTANPRVSFHWPGVVASQIGMDSAGTIRTYDNPGTGYAPFTAGGITATNRLTVSEANGAYTYITLRDDESPSGYKYIHANSNVVGFLNSGGGWSAYWDNNGSQYNVGSINATDFYIRNTGKWASSLGTAPTTGVDTSGNWTWTRVVSNTYAPGPGNRSGWFYVGLDATRPILGMRISGSSDDGGACVATIGNYFSAAVTNMAYINALNLNGTWSGSAWSTNAGPMATGQWIFDGTPAGRNLGAQSYTQNTAYNKAAGLMAIPAGQGLSYSQWYNDGQGGYGNTCYIDVLYATSY